jgi:leader peptidase (prepilin peptidase)/N-methyltransferase
VSPLGLAAAGVGGLVVGSFLNVVIHRLPRHESLVAPRSRCPACQAPIRPADNVPVVSFLALRGRCRACRQPIPWRYPAVELGTAGLFVALAARLGPVAVLPAYLVLAASLVAVAAIDAATSRIPRSLVWATAALGAPLLVVGALPGGQWHRLAAAAVGAAVGFGFLYLVHVAAPRGMGFGDVRLSGLIGGFLGWLGVAYALIGLFLAFLYGGVVGVGLVAGRRRGWGSRLPFGPFLAAGALSAVLFGGPIRQAWLGG